MLAQERLKLQLVQIIQLRMMDQELLKIQLVRSVSSRSASSECWHLVLLSFLLLGAALILPICIGHIGKILRIFIEINRGVLVDRSPSLLLMRARSCSSPSILKFIPL